MSVILSSLRLTAEMNLWWNQFCTVYNKLFLMFFTNMQLFQDFQEIMVNMAVMTENENIPDQLFPANKYSLWKKPLNRPNIWQVLNEPN